MQYPALIKDLKGHEVFPNSLLSVLSVFSCPLHESFDINFSSASPLGLKFQISPRGFSPCVSLPIMSLAYDIADGEPDEKPSHKTSSRPLPRQQDVIDGVVGDDDPAESGRDAPRDYARHDRSDMHRMGKIQELRVSGKTRVALRGGS